MTTSLVKYTIHEPTDSLYCNIFMEKEVGEPRYRDELFYNFPLSSPPPRLRLPSAKTYHLYIYSRSENSTRCLETLIIPKEILDNVVSTLFFDIMSKQHSLTNVTIRADIGLESSIDR